MSGRLGLAGAGLVIAGAVMIGAGALAGGGLGRFGLAAAREQVPTAGGTAGGPSGAAGGGYGFGMMGGGFGGFGGFGPGMMGGLAAQSAPGPGEAGFVAGTQASPRVIRIVAGPGDTFEPSSVTVAKGETVTFEVTGVGPLTHEFMVGPADAVAADQAGTPEVTGITMMQTASLTYTFDGTGPYAYACHAPGHYEAGMRGTITVAG